MIKCTVEFETMSLEVEADNVIDLMARINGIQERLDELNNPPESTKNEPKISDDWHIVKTDEKEVNPDESKI